jgi:hypothetical protein
VGPGFQGPRPSLGAYGLSGSLQVGGLQGTEKQSGDISFELLARSDFAAELTIDTNEIVIG